MVIPLAWRIDQDGVDLAGKPQIPLNAIERREDRPDFRLLGSKRELTEPIAGHHSTDVEPNRAADVVLAPEQRFDWYGRRLLQAHEQHVSGGSNELRGKCGGKNLPVGAGRPWNSQNRASTPYRGTSRRDGRTSPVSRAPVRRAAVVRKPLVFCSSAATGP